MGSEKQPVIGNKEIQGIQDVVGVLSGLQAMRSPAGSPFSRFEFTSPRRDQGQEAKSPATPIELTRSEPFSPGPSDDRLPLGPSPAATDSEGMLRVLPCAVARAGGDEGSLSSGDGTVCPLDATFFPGAAPSGGTEHAGYSPSTTKNAAEAAPRRRSRAPPDKAPLKLLQGPHLPWTKR